MKSKNQKSNCLLDKSDSNASMFTPLNRAPSGKFNRAKIGVRRNPQNPSKKQKIFGYNLVLTTSVELHLKLELLSEA